MTKKDNQGFSSFFNREQPPVLEGLIGWLVVFSFILPSSLQDYEYVQVVLLLGPLVVVPLGIRYSGAWLRFLQPIGWALFPSALLTCLPYCVPQMDLLGFAAAPWLMWCVMAAVLAFRHFIGSSQFSALPLLVGFLYLPVGAAWLLADRLGIHPLGFRDPIVILTAAHFHFAGFILPVLVSRYLLFTPRPLGRVVTWGIMLGIPLVAVGITASHWGAPSWVEAVLASAMALSGLGLAFWVIGSALRQKIGWRQIPALSGGILLSMGMVLALFFAWRSHPDVPFRLTISWMYAVHGTINVVACILLMVIPLPFVEDAASTAKATP